MVPIRLIDCGVVRILYVLLVFRFSLTLHFYRVTSAKLHKYACLHMGVRELWWDEGVLMNTHFWDRELWLLTCVL